MHNVHQDFFTQLQSVQLHQISPDWKYLFEFEYLNGTIIRDGMLKLYNWTNEGIEFTFVDIRKTIHTGKFQCSVSIGTAHDTATIDIKGILGECCVSQDECYNCNNVKPFLLWLYLWTLQYNVAGATVAEW